jgi:uncharacterized protein YrrD
MLTAQRLIGLPVIALVDGQEVGTVKHVLLDMQRGKVLGLAVDDGRWWRGCPVVPLDKVVGMGEEAVTIPGVETLSAAETVAGLEESIVAARPVIGQRVLSKDGAAVGVVSDYAFEAGSGKIASLEVAPWVQAGEAGIPTLIRAEQVLVFGRDAIVVGGERREPRVAGGAAAGAVPGPETASRPGVATRHKAAPRPEAAVSPGASAVPDVAPALDADRLPSTAPASAPTSILAFGGSRPAAELARLFQERQERFLLGKRAQRAVRDETGEVLVAPGEVVTPELLSKVKSAGRLLDLTASVSLRA